MKTSYYKKIVGAALLLVAALSSCRKETDVFDESPDQRMEAYLQNAQQVLLAAENGWVGTVTSQAGPVFNYYMQFDGNNRVKMYSDFDTVSSGVFAESGYRLKGLQQPSLLFDTYSYVHLPADPQGSVNGGEDGQGLLTDFEFALDSVSSGYLRLKGRFNRSTGIFRAATREEAEKWTEHKWQENIEATMSLQKFSTYFTRMQVDGSDVCDIAINHYNRQIRFSSYSPSGGVNITMAAYHYADAETVLNEPVTINGITIEKLEDLHWDDATQTVVFRTNGKQASISAASSPIVVDAGAYRRWRNAALNAGSLWYASYGIVHEWQGDYTQIGSSTRFYLMGYIPGSTPSTDRLITAYLTEAQDDIEGVYGYFVSPALQPGGTVIFTDMTAYREANGLTPVTAGDAPDAKSGAAMRQSMLELTIPEGFYVIQTGANSYDMVSAKDARTWFNWELY